MNTNISCLWPEIKSGPCGVVPTYHYRANVFPWLHKNPRSAINLRVVLEWEDKSENVKRHQVKYPHKWKKQDSRMGVIDEGVEEEDVPHPPVSTRRSLLYIAASQVLGLISQFWKSIGYKILGQWKASFRLRSEVESYSGWAIRPYLGSGL